MEVAIAALSLRPSVRVVRAQSSWNHQVALHGRSCVNAFESRWNLRHSSSTTVGICSHTGRALVVR
jgi:hypothetical protein